MFDEQNENSALAPEAPPEAQGIVWNKETQSFDNMPAPSAEEIEAKLLQKAEEAKRKRHATNQKKYRERLKTKEDSESEKYDSPTEISDADAREILVEQRGLKDEQDISACIKFAHAACRLLKIPFNKHLFAFGLAKTLEARSLSAAVEPLDIVDEWIIGYRSRRRELYAMWDYVWSVPGREFEGEKVSFDKYLWMIRQCMADGMFLGVRIHGLNFRDTPDGPHGEWFRDFFVVKNPDLLPERYDLESQRRALSEQSPIKIHGLYASRNSFKSYSAIVVDLIQWTLVFPSIRILLCSATRQLSRGFVKLYRQIWEIKNHSEPTLFQMVFPSFCISVNESYEDHFTSPKRILDRIQPTLAYTSLESTVAGERCDLLQMEDPVEINNSRTPEMRATTLERMDLVRELLEPNQYLQINGTPTHDGDALQVYKERAEESDEKSALFRIDPCWVLKPEAKHKIKNPASIQESDIEKYLFKELLSFPVLKRKISKDPSSHRTFLQQQMCVWVPDEDQDEKLQFTEDMFRSHQRPLEFFVNTFGLTGKIVLGIDTAWSTGEKADRTALVVAQQFRNSAGRPSLVILHSVSGRFRDSEIVFEILKILRQFHVSELYIEKANVSQCTTILGSLNRQALEQNLLLPRIAQIPPMGGGLGSNRKLEKFKRLELALAEDRFWIVSCAAWNDTYIADFTWLDGITKSNGGKKKDDHADATSLCFHALPGGFPAIDKTTDEAQEEAARLEREAAHRNYVHQMMHGPSDTLYRRPSDPEVQSYGIRGVPTRKAS